MDLISRVKNTITRYHLFSTNSTILIGISGGPDSVVLLNVLNELKNEYGLKLYAAHINHRLRKNSLKDEQFVTALTRQLKIPIFVKRLNKNIFSRKTAIEETAREERLKFFTQTAQKLKINLIALGHNQDDLAETVLMRLIRGTGLKGLRAMAPKRILKNFFFIRPLIETPRKDIEQFLKKNKLAYRVDPTNFQTRFTRNKIRRQLIPLLEREYNPKIKALLSHLAMTLADDYDFLENYCRHEFRSIYRKASQPKTITLQLNKLIKYPGAIQHYFIRFAVEALNEDVQLSWNHMNEIEDLIARRPVHSIVHLPHHTSVKRYKNFLIFRAE